MFDLCGQRSFSHSLAFRARDDYRQVGSQAPGFLIDLAAMRPGQSSIQKKHVNFVFLRSNQVQCGRSVACLEDGKTWKTVPLPGSQESRIVPLRHRTIAETAVRPNPCFPVVFLVKNGSKTLACTSSVMPGPCQRLPAAHTLPQSCDRSSPEASRDQGNLCRGHADHSVPVANRL